MDDRCWRASASRFGSSCHTLSRPRCARRTRPASSITRRCLAIAWRLMSKLLVSFTIDVGPSSLKRATRPNRVSSPRAKNTAADATIRAPAAALRRLPGKILLDERHLLRPATLVRRERLGAPLERDAVEAGFGDGQQDAARLVLQCELDQRRRLPRVVDAGLDGEWMPAKREESLRLDAIDRDVERHAGVRLLHRGHLRIDGGRCDGAAHWRAG